ncbi:MAG: hypothetical protein H0T62_03955 [Parachlamydiaceae bacterium]|nr:hypothetical protein [Parachlamydiaceae bacterium]
MADDTEWEDFSAYSGEGVALGHPTPNGGMGRLAKEGPLFTSLYCQADCTAPDLILNLQNPENPVPLLKTNPNTNLQLPSTKEINMRSSFSINRDLLS